MPKHDSKSAYKSRALRRGKSSHSIVLLIYGIIVFTLLVGTCFQIYRLSVGKVPSAIPIDSLPASKRAPSKALPKPVEISSNPNVKKILAMQPLNIEKLGGNSSRVTFRSESGQVICTIAKKLQQKPPKLVPLTTNIKGEEASGEGVICTSIYRQHTPDPAITAKCATGNVTMVAIGLWNNQIGLGACNTSRLGPLGDDANAHIDNPAKSERYKVFSLGPEQYTKLGKYACGMSGASVTCVNVETGKGFTYSDGFGYKVL